MKNCSCKGIRSCLKCERDSFQSNDHKQKDSIKEYIYCYKCENKAYLKDKFDKHECCLQTSSTNDDDMLMIDGVFLQEEVVTKDEECKIIESIDSHIWIDSQSGRRKQDFGPKINFKRKKIKFDCFVGLPKLDMEIFEKIKNNRIRATKDNYRFEWPSLELPFVSDCSDNILRNFKTVEICHLEYMPERGSSIDPHFDDFWVWGERLVTLNLFSSTVLSLSDNNVIVSILLNPRSFLVLYGDARYKYKHAIDRAQIRARRLAITYRELAINFLEKNNPEYDKFGKTFIQKSNYVTP